MLTPRNTNKPQMLFGIRLDSVTLSGAIARIHEWIQSEAHCRYIVTPNTDHIVQLQHNPDLRQAYEAAGLVLTDGWPVALAARVLGKPVVSVVPGSDLVPHLFDAPFPRKVRVFLFGAAPGVAQRAAVEVQSRHTNVEVVGCYSPPFGFDHDEVASIRAIERINAARPDILIVGLGAPKQEIWIHRYRLQIRARVAICAGATIDFLAGEKRRAPKWLRKLRLEWLHRLATEPKRLGTRYARDAVRFPQIVAREWFSKRREPL